VQLNGNYRDPILLQIWIASGVGDRVRDPWFTGYVTTPRWLRLDRSGAGIRSVAGGFELRMPEDEGLRQPFLGVCSGRVDVTVTADQVVLAVLQLDGVDSVDRVLLGAELLNQLVAAGLLGWAAAAAPTDSVGTLDILPAGLCRTNRVT